MPLRVATLNGAHCTWEGVDPATIRIRPTAKIEIPFLGTINFDFDFRIQKGGKAGVLELLGAPIPLQRDAGGSANT